MSNSKDYPLVTVIVVALTCMMAVQIFGIYYDAMFRVPKTQTVECSTVIKDMARNLNIELLDKCEVVR